MLKHLSLALFASCAALALLLLPPPAAGSEDPVQEGEMAGYLLVPHEKVPETYNAGFSMYVAAWPLLKEYPGQRFQTGLFGTWMFAQYDGPEPAKLYSDIEGGLGWWRDTRFATETPKFIMGGVALNFSEWANGPGAGKGRDWDKPKGQYGVAQLSPWVLWPPDGLNLKQGTCGELVGYGYLPLPLTAPKSDHRRQERSDRGPLLDPVPEHAELQRAGRFLHPLLLVARVRGRPPPERAVPGQPARPSRTRRCRWRPSTSPRSSPSDAKGETYARIAPTSFPRNADGDSVVVHRITAYNKSALWDAVKTWFDGGAPASGAIDPKGASVHTFSGKGRVDLEDLSAEHPEGEKGAACLEVRLPPPSPSIDTPTDTGGTTRW